MGAVLALELGEPELSVAHCDGRRIRDVMGMRERVGGGTVQQGGGKDEFETRIKAVKVGFWLLGEGGDRGSSTRESG